MKIKKLLIDLRDLGKTIIVACHDREELDFLSDTIFELEEGKVVKTYGGKGYEDN